MQKKINSIEELGEIIAATRIDQGIHADEFNISHVTVGAIETGKTTTQIGKVFELMDALGIYIIVDAPLDKISEKKRRRVSK